jgi:uncharacterized protein (TIGR02145 family)
MKNIFRISVVILSIFLIHSCKKKEEVPVITTTAVSNITATTATSGGNITSEGSSTVISRGVCWSTGTTPTIADSKTADGAGAGSFPSNIIDLFGGTTYYVRAYATNGSGIGYGMALSFKTSGQPPSAPTVTTKNATSIQTSSAQLNGTVNANYYSTVVTFEYGTTTTYGSTATATQSPVSGGTNSNVSAPITGLTAGTIYHYRIKAVNSLGTTNSNDITFTTVGLVPTVTTLAATNITTVAAQLNGTVNANYLSTVVTFEYGITTGYGSTATVTLSPVTGSTNTNVNAYINGLTEGTTYHFRVKAVNSLGTTNSSDMTFTTLGAVPTASTTAITIITTTGATVNGIVNANYLSTTVSFEYGLTIGYGSTVTATPNTVTGNTYVSASISGLTVGTNYHYRVVSTNSLGTTNGNDMTFTTAPATVNDVDGNTYNVVAIGAQVWIKENLNTTKYNDGTAIPNVTDNTAWTVLTTGAYSDYSNNPANSTIYGRLYNWYAVDNNAATKLASNSGKNVCPTSWHVPTNTEWTTLTTYLGEYVAGSKLKETGTTHWTSPNTGATNETGFTALPGGVRGNNDGAYNNIGSNGFWWSSTEYSSALAWFSNMSFYFTNVNRNNNNKQYGFSVRCVRDL